MWMNVCVSFHALAYLLPAVMMQSAYVCCVYERERQSVCAYMHLLPVVVTCIGVLCVCFCVLVL